MLIKRLVLVGYKRLMLNNIQHFEYTPVSKYQLILGTNGSGKSSVIAELSPLPAHSSNFIKTGSKLIELSHLGRDYVLTSTMRTSKHSFVCDGEELNPGGTADSQRKLVVHHFGYSKDLHELLIGRTLFTAMNPTDRRKWITELSSVDYTYAIGVHRKAASAARDALGVTRHLSQRLTQENTTLQSMSDVQDQSARARTLEDELSALLRAQLNGLPHSRELQQRLNDAWQSIETQGKRALELIIELQSLHRFGSFNGLQHAAGHAQASQGQLEKQLQERSHEHQDLMQSLSSLSTREDVTPENVDGYILEAQADLSRFEQDYRFTFQDLDGANETLHETRQIADEIQALFFQLPEDPENEYNQQAMKELEGRRQDIVTFLSRIDGRIQQVEKRLHAIQCESPVNCPNCQHQWKLNAKPREEDELKETLTLGLSKRAEAESRLNALETQITEMREVLHLYERVRRMTSSYPRLRGLWLQVTEQQMMKTQPKRIHTLLAAWQRDVEAAIHRGVLQNRLNELQSLSEQWAKLGGGAHLNQRIARLASDVERLSLELHTVRDESRDLQWLQRQAGEADRLLEQLSTLTLQAQKTFDQLLSAQRNEQIDVVVRSHHHELAMIRHMLTERGTLQGIVRDLESSLIQAETDRQALSLIADALSPKEGLVAEQLCGFIECLVAQMNSIIGSVWAHDLSVQPCGMASGELDYKFPLHVASSDNRSPDVAESSKGQQQMVNLAFQLTVMLYKGLHDFPLFLDEPGEGFDDQHRKNLMGFIKRLMDNDHHSQLFMVSHYASNHGSFVAADVVVLDDSNIQVPGSYNECVVIA